MLNIFNYEKFILIKENKLRYIGENPTAEVVLMRTIDNVQQILLIKRSKYASAEPNKWAFPGGFIDTKANIGSKWISGYETEIHAAKREVLEETGLDLLNMDDSKFKLIGIYDNKERDPRNDSISWVKNFSFKVEIPSNIGDNVRGMDDAEDAKWFTLNDLNNMYANQFAFDHRERLLELGFIV